MHSIPKRQHFVPQLYLRQFAVSEQIFAYDKSSRRSYRTNTSNVAVESFFYGFPNELVDSIRHEFPDDIIKALKGVDFRVVLEYWFQPLEDTIGALLPHLSDRLETQKYFRLKNNEQEALAVFVTIQLLRTKEQRAFIVELTEQAIAHGLMKRTPGHLIGSDPPNITLDPQYESLFHAQVLLDRQLRNAIVDLLLSRSRVWRFWLNTTGTPFYASDSPVVVYSHNDDATGIASPGVEMALPLSPNLILIIADVKAMTAGERRRHRKMHKRAAVMNDVENVKFYNTLQVYQSYRQVFCQTDEFDFADQVCEANPDLCEMDRQRVSIRWPSGTGPSLPTI